MCAYPRRFSSLRMTAPVPTGTVDLMTRMRSPSCGGRLSTTFHTRDRSASPLWVGGVSTQMLSLIHISEPTRLRRISYAVFCLKKKKQTIETKNNKTENEQEKEQAQNREKQK